MSIIYKALQKTQRNREKGANIITPGINMHRYSYLIDISLIIVIALLLSSIIFVCYPRLKSVFGAPTKSQETPIINEAAFKTTYLLTGIFTSDQTRMAMINNHYYYLGDWVGGAQIVSINDKSITLQRDKQIFQLEVPL